ncbi:hypothetical protein os4_36720 (plasmid) [Comamonadaceae bacterium OS-4]|nr:hypothetical protein os4_36720 [Comamonadaceae bacterium OS-4]
MLHSKGEQFSRPEDITQAAAEKTAILRMFLKDWRSTIPGELLYNDILKSPNCECGVLLESVDATPHDKYAGVTLRTIGIALHEAVLQHQQTLPSPAQGAQPPHGQDGVEKTLTGHAVVALRLRHLHLRSFHVDPEHAKAALHQTMDSDPLKAIPAEVTFAKNGNVRMWRASPPQ